MKKEAFVTKEQIEEIVKTYPTPFHIYDEKGIRKYAICTGIEGGICMEQRI